MGRLTRAIDRRRASSHSAGLVLVMLALIVCAVAAGSAARLAPPASAAPAAETALQARSDAQLAAEVRQLEGQASRTGELLLMTDAERDGIVRTRDAARDLLGQFLADSYRRNVSAGGGISQLLAAASINEAADRVRVAQVISRHHTSIIRSLDAAETRIAVSQIERARLIVELSATQQQLVKLSEEQGRRATLRAAHEAARVERKRAAAAAARKRTAAAAASSGFMPGAQIPPPGALVANSPTATRMVPGGPISAAVIDSYLASKGSPMTGQGAAFMASGQRWRVDPRLLVAIAGAESNFGQITCGPNNAWGWACPNDPAEFSTWAMGIDTVTSGLRRYYLDEGRTSVALIQQKYCPVGAANDPTGLNSHWLTNVTKFLVELGGNPNVIGPGPSGGVAAPMFSGFASSR